MGKIYYLRSLHGAYVVGICWIISNSLCVYTLIVRNIDVNLSFLFYCLLPIFLERTKLDSDQIALGGAKDLALMITDSIYREDMQTNEFTYTSIFPYLLQRKSNKIYLISLSWTFVYLIINGESLHRKA